MKIHPVKPRIFGLNDQKSLLFISKFSDPSLRTTALRPSEPWAKNLIELLYKYLTYSGNPFYVINVIYKFYLFFSIRTFSKKKELRECVSRLKTLTSSRCKLKLQIVAIEDELAKSSNKLQLATKKLNDFEEVLIFTKFLLKQWPNFGRTTLFLLIALYDTTKVNWKVI